MWLTSFVELTAASQLVSLASEARIMPTMFQKNALPPPPSDLAWSMFCCLVGPDSPESITQIKEICCNIYDMMLLLASEDWGYGITKRGLHCRLGCWLPSAKPMQRHYSTGERQHAFDLDNQGQIKPGNGAVTLHGIHMNGLQFSWAHYVMVPDN